MLGMHYSGSVAVLRLQDKQPGIIPIPLLN